MVAVLWSHRLRIIHPLFDQAHESLSVQLPSRDPTRREVIRAISDQTGFRASIFHCGNGATVVFGGGMSRISVRDWEKQRRDVLDGLPKTP